MRKIPSKIILNIDPLMMSSKLPKVGKNEITENIFQEFLLSTEMINEFLPPALPTTHFQVGPKTNNS